jgi:hypothetical protein
MKIRPVKHAISFIHYFKMVVAHLVHVLLLIALCAIVQIQIVVWFVKMDIIKMINI